MSSYLLECCVDSAESALNAAQGGADRLELCSGLVIGGITPTLSLYEQVRRHTGLPIHILIRPRFGDFLYSNQELSVMEADIRAFRQAGAQGVVIGCLTPEGDLDPEAMKRLMAAAGGMSITLHRAFDMCRDPFRTLAQAKALGINTILTSGQAATAPEGAALLGELVERAGERIAILAGSGVSAASVPALSRVGVRQFHASAKKTVDGPMAFRRGGVPMGLPLMDEYARTYTDAAQVAAIRAAMAEMAVETCTNSPKAL